MDLIFEWMGKEEFLKFAKELQDLHDKLSAKKKLEELKKGV